MTGMITVAILIVSDRVYQGIANDKSSEAITQLLLENNDNQKESNGNEVPFKIMETYCVPDQMDLIQEKVKKWTDEDQIALILTTGGTGFGVRDITPEAIKPLLHKEASGITIAMMTKSLNITPLASLSRPVAGIRYHSLILTLPGSTKGATENLSSVIRVLKHACDLAQGDLRKHAEKMHQMMNGPHGSSFNDESYQNIHTQKDIQHKGDHPQQKQKVSFAKCNCYRPSDQPLLDTSSSSSNTNNLSSPTISNRYQDQEEIKSNLLNSTVAQRARLSPYPLVSYENAVETVLHHAKPSAIIVTIDVNEDMTGFVVAKDIYSERNIPNFRASIVDGYAIQSNRGEGEYKIVGAVTAGQDILDSALSDEKIAIRITTGAPIPDGMDSVVMVEDTELLSTTSNGEEKTIRIKTTVLEGENIRPIGCDIVKDSLLISKGMVVDDIGGALGVFISCGIKKIQVFRRPNIAIMSSGNEIVSIEQEANETQVYDTNRPCLKALLKKENIKPKDYGIVPDSPEQLENVIGDGLLNDTDVIISTGGVSMGEHDYIKSVLEQKFNAKIEFGRVFLKPGKPTTFAVIPRTNLNKPPCFFFGLPGNPVSTIVTFNLIVLPFIRKFSGREDSTLTKIKVKLTHDVKLDPRPEFHRAILEPIQETTMSNEAVGFLATTTGNQRSSRIMSVKSVHALLQMPSSKECNKPTLEKGSIVPALLLTQL